MLAAETATGGVVRLGSRIVVTLTPEDAKDSDRAWLEGAFGQRPEASGLEWDRWRCAAVAEVVRTQREDWELAVVRGSWRIGGQD